MTITDSAPRTIRASINQDAIKRVPAFFDASLDDIMNELLQNCRRSGSPVVQITTQPGRITVQDYGAGIPDPAVLLSFGNSTWDQPDIRDERPAGMGLYALSRLSRVTVTSHTAEQAPWRVTLTPEHFNGQADATVHQLTATPGDHHTGVVVSFDWNHDTESAIARAARYFPLPVTCNGQPVPQESFLAEALHVKEWRGLLIGVFPSVRNRYVGTPNINFHGVVIQDNQLPEVPTMRRNTTYTVRVDVRQCPEMELTLPARKELIQNEFLDELRQEGRRAIYEYLATTDDVAVPYRVQQEALELGITLPDAPPWLSTWVPPTECAGHFGYDPAYPKTPPDEALLIAFDEADPTQHTFHRAARLAGVADYLFQSNDANLRGYPWYDRIRRITRITTQAEFGDRRFEITGDYDNLPADAVRADHILVTAHVTNPDGSEQTLEMQTDAALVDEADTYIDDVRPLVTRDTAITVEELSELMMHGYFYPSEDLDADSPATQINDALEFTRQNVISLLQSPEAARLENIRTALQTSDIHSLPSGSLVVVEVKPSRQLEISINPADTRLTAHHSASA